MKRRTFVSTLAEALHVHARLRCAALLRFGGVAVIAVLTMGAMVWFLSGGVAPSAHAADAAAQPLQILPGPIALHTSRDRQTVAVDFTRTDGVSRDVTDEASVSVADPSIAKLQNHFLVPLKDGKTELRATFKGNSASVPLEVVDAAVDRPISFKLDVMPVFMRSGCNTGACHGAAKGKDGFRLSLFGFDPDGDYFRLTREMPNRRINLAEPAQSLVLQKGIGAVQHTGGKRFEVGSDYYNTIFRWIDAGTPEDKADVAKPVSLELLPGKTVMETGAKMQLIAMAHYSDGQVRDVTPLAVFLTSNDTSAAVTPEGLITAGARGEAFVMARFATFTVGTPVIVIPPDLKFEFPNVPENNYIDQLVDQKLRRLRIAPSPLCTDEEFIRRVYIDLIGLLPTRQEHDDFVASKDPAKRSKVIDDLLGRREFVDIWVMKWAELLEIRSDNNGNGTGLSYKNAVLYYDWLEDRISRNVPFDKVVRELISANGGTFRNPPTNYYQNTTDTLKLAENTAQIFMGVRTQCAQCHNHPFDRWTMNDYYGFASFFTRIARKKAEDPREEIITSGGGNEVKNPVTEKVDPPKFLGGPVPDLKNGEDRRLALANWITSDQNPYFDRNLANMVWAHFLGRGIVDPVDDVRASNPPSNPELLEALGQHYRSYQFDLRHLVRDICNSRAYQESTAPNDTNGFDERNFSHAMVRRMPAEVLLDCIDEVTNTREKFKGLPIGSRSVQIVDGQTTNYFLTTFGRAKRETVCTCEVSMQPNLSQALHMLNGDTTNRKVRDGQVIQKALTARKPAPQIIEDLYIRTLGRMPSKAEMDRLMENLAPPPTTSHSGKKEPAVITSNDSAEVLYDIFWALLNSNEFMFNH